MANFFDQFDAPIKNQPIANFFDQFDAPIKKQTTANFFDQFDTAQNKPAVAPEPPPETESFSTLRQIADVPLQAGKGLVQGVRMVADAFGAGSDTSKSLKSAENYVANLMSAQSKEDSKEIARIMKEAEDKGALDQVKAAVKAMTVAPVDFIANALGTAAPAIVASLGATVLGPVAVLGAGVLTGATMGAGTVKGTIYDSVKDELSKTKMPPDQIEARAQLAQAYNGQNLDMILTGAAIGTLGATTGAEAAIARQMAKGILAKTAIKQELSKVQEEELKKAAMRGAIKQGAVSGTTEFGTEFAQAGQEQLAQNVALQREGFDVPTMRGVVGQATLEGLAGAGLGSLAGGREALKAKDILDQREYLKSEKERLTKEQVDKEQKANQVIPPEQDVDALLASSITPPAEVKPIVPLNAEVQSIVDRLQADLNKRQVQIDDKSHPNVAAATKTNQKLKIAIDAINTGTPLEEAIKNLNPKQIETLNLGELPKQTSSEQAEVLPPLTKTPAEIALKDPVVMAKDYMASIGDTPGSMPILKNISNKLKLNVPTGPGFVARAKTAIQEHLAQLGEASNVQPTDTTTTGTSAEALGAPGTDITAAGAAPVDQGGVAVNNIVSTGLEGGESQQPNPLINSLIEEANNSGVTVDPNDTFESLQLKINQQKAATDFNAAGSDLLNILGNLTGAKVNFTPDEEVQLMPTLVKLFDAAAKLGYYRLEEAIKYVKDYLFKNAGQQQANKFEQEFLQRAYAEFRNTKERRGVQRPVTEEQKIQQRAELERSIQENDAQQQAALLQDFEKAEARETEYQEVLAEDLNEPLKRIDVGYSKGNVAPEIVEEYEAAREEFNANLDSDKRIREWSRLNADQKELYLNYIGRNTIEEHDKAIQALYDYNQSSIASQLELDPKQRRIVNNYNRLTKYYGDKFKIDFPNWLNLSPESQQIYLGKVTNNQPTVQQEGFKAIADQLELEGKGIRGLDKADIEGLKLRQTNEATQIASQERIVQEKAAEESAQGKGEPLSAQMIKELKDGNINYVLGLLSSQAKGLINLRLVKGDKTYRQGYSYFVGLRKRAAELTFKLLASNLNQIEYSSKVVTDPNDKVIQRLEQEGKLAEYDPKTDTFYFTEKGFDESTFLHEVVHAGTVKLISTFLDDPMNTKGQLLPHQHQALRHLADIYQFAKKRLGGKYKNAFENIYEFVSYALTDNAFQIELSNIQSRNLANYTRRAIKDLWSNLTTAFSKLFGLYDPKQDSIKLPTEIYQQLAKEWSAIDPNSLYKNLQKVETVGDLAEALNMEDMETLEVGPEVYGKETKIATKTQKTVKQADRFLTSIPGYEGNLLLEISEIFNDILEAPEVGTNVAPLAAKAQPVGKKAKPFLEVKDVYGDNPAFEPPKSIQKNSFTGTIKDMFSYQGIQKNITKFQNERRAITNLTRNNRRGGLNIDSGPNVNNIELQVTTAPSKAVIEFGTNVQKPYEDLQQAMVEFAKTDFIINTTEKINADKKAKGEPEITTVGFMQGVLHIYGQAFTDLERRLNMFVQSAPLSLDKNISINGKTISAADLRDLILGDPVTKKAGILDNPNLSETQARQLWERLEQYVFITDAKGNKIPNPQYVVVGGSSPLGRTAIDFRTAGGNTQYNVTGFTYEETARFLAEYEKDVNKPLLDKIFKATWDLNAIALELNKKSYYVSKPAANWIAAYGYKNYVPLKGITNHNSITQKGALNFNGKKLEQELADTAIKSEGRFSISKNPILQSMSEAMISATRAGRGPNYTLAIKNSVGKSPKTIDGKKVDLNPNGQGLIKGKVVEHIPFNERSYDAVKEVRKQNTVFHHNEDGSIDVIEIEDQAMLEAIRRPYKEQNQFIEYSNRITSGLGQVHTRYNINFGPLNFVRDALTNAWNIGAEIGPIKGAELIMQVAYQVTSKNSLTKAWKVAKTYKTPEFEKFKNSNDPVIRNMYELIKEGGMVEYMAGISLRSNLEKLDQELNKSKSRIVKTVDGLNTIIDSWTNMFEIASRSAAYGLLKEHYIKTEKLGAVDARMRAATATKNLANFEQVGEYGKAMGALFMFYRPSATGAVTALDAFAPAMWNSMERAVKNAPDYIKNNPVALETFKKNYRTHQLAARQMSTALFGLGVLAYTMSYMMSDTDDEERNKTLTDDMGKWTRFARFHIVGFEKPFQIPWGFGLGAFAAMGAQLAAVVSGQQSFMAALNNGATQIALDSFVPLPVSRMNIADNPAMWFIDSISPSAVRPVVEFVANKNGLGQSIYNDATGRRMGDAYLGGDHVPETYKMTTRFLANLTNGYIDWTPNTMYFLVNSYADGPARLVDFTINNYYYATGDKEFDAKTNIPLLGSFIGAPPNVDTREFASVEKQILKMSGNLNMFKSNPEQYIKYVTDNPFDVSLVKLYDKSIGDLNKLRSEDKKLRLASYTPAERKPLLDANRKYQNLLKHNMIEMFKAYGVEP
jgi:hypothetical protein